MQTKPDEWYEDTLALDAAEFEGETVTTLRPRDDVSTVLGDWPFQDLPGELVATYGQAAYYLVTTRDGYAAIRYGVVSPLMEYAGDTDSVAAGWCWPLADVVLDVPVDLLVTVREWARYRLPIVLQHGNERRLVVASAVPGEEVRAVVYLPDAGWRWLDEVFGADVVNSVIETCSARASGNLPAALGGVG